MDDVVEKKCPLIGFQPCKKEECTMYRPVNRQDKVKGCAILKAAVAVTSMNDRDANKKP